MLRPCCRAVLVVFFALGLAAAPVAAQTTYPALVYGTVTVGANAFDLLLDLQVPAGQGPWPVVVWIHGGGWSGGSRLPIPGSVTRLVARGYAVASIDYRLTGQAIWPAQIHDCKAAIRFLRGNAATWGLDSDRIGVMGSSAGGHLVAALATMGGVGTVRSGGYVVDLEGAVGAHVGMSSRVQCAVDLFGPTDMLLANDFPTFDHDIASSPESQLVGGALQANAEKWATVDPIPFVTPDDAPLLVLHGTDDTSVPFVMSERLVAAARAIGNDVAFLPIQDNGHGGPGFSTPAVTAVTDAFFDRTLRDLPSVVVGVTASDPIANENGDTATFVVTRTGATTAPLAVRLWLGGTVEPGADCAPLPLTVTIPAGQANVALPFVALQDALVEGDETAVLHVVPTGAYRVDHAADSATATLVDDDVAAGLPVVTLQQFDAAASEAPGDPGAIRCVRTGSTALPLLVNYRVLGTATNGADYAALSGTATIPAGSAVTLVVVVPLQDNAREPGETVVLELQPAPLYALGAARTGHVVLAADDRSSLLPVVGVIATDPDLGEPGNAGHVTVTRTGPTTQLLAVPIVIGGKAQPGVDLQPLPSIATIPAGAAWVRVPIQVWNDTAVEGDESLSVSIAANGGYVRSLVSTSVVVLGDDEAPPPVSPVSLLVGPLTIGRSGIATLAGGAAFGIAALYFSPAPAYVPLPPFGTVELDPSALGFYAAGLLDGDGSVTWLVPIDDTLSLVGLPTWWQAIATTAPVLDLVLSTAAQRVVGAPAPVRED